MDYFASLFESQNEPYQGIGITELNVLYQTVWHDCMHRCICGLKRSSFERLDIEFGNLCREAAMTVGSSLCCFSSALCCYSLLSSLITIDCITFVIYCYSVYCIKTFWNGSRQSVCSPQPQLVVLSSSTTSSVSCLTHMIWEHFLTIFASVL